MKTPDQTLEVITKLGAHLKKGTLTEREFRNEVAIALVDMMDYVANEATK